MDQSAGFRRIVVGAGVAVLLLTSHIAAADAIDGNWCYGDGRHMSIQGPEIVTPAGTSMRGNYDRHSFSYVVPEAGPDQGSVLSIVQLNEDLVHLTGRAPEPDAVEEWRRCEFVS